MILSHGTRSCHHNSHGIESLGFRSLNAIPKVELKQVCSDVLQLNFFKLAYIPYLSMKKKKKDGENHQLFPLYAILLLLLFIFLHHILC